MADRKISDLTALTTPATGDLIPIVDISEAAAADKNKSITVGELLRGAPDGTAAAPGIAFESDGGNGMFLGGTDILAFSTGGSQAVTIDASQRLGVGTSSPSALLSVFQSAEGEVANFGTSDTSRLLRIVTGTANSISGALITLKTDSAEGEIAFGTGGGTERVRIDNSGNIGIGVTSPINALHINGAAGAASSRFRLSSTEGSGFTIRSESATETMLNVDSSEHLLFGVGGGEVARIRSNGFVGINTTTPDARLEVVESSTGSVEIARMRIEGQTNNPMLRIFADEANKTITFAAQGSVAGNQLVFSEDGSEAFRVDSSGRLLVGTSSTSATCRAIVQSESSDAGGSGIFLLSRGNNSPASTQALGQLWFTDSGHGQAASIEGSRDGGTWTSGSSQPSKLTFSTTADGASSPTERMRIRENGTVLIGKTTTDVGGNGTIVDSDGALFATIPSGNTLHVYSSAASAYRFYVENNGTINATNTTISAISDQRLKENIRDLDTGLNEIMALQPRRFDWKAGKGKDIQNDQGFIAQEFEQVFPEMVGEWLDPAPEGEEPYKSVRADLIPVLVKAIQDQQSIINGLEARLAALEAN